MICKSAAFTGIFVPNHLWVLPIWSNRITLNPEQYYSPNPSAPGQAPTSLENVVYAVANATNQVKELHAIGSTWAFSDIAASASWTIQINMLQSRLDYVVATGSGLTDAWRQMQNNPTAETQLVHVEVGMEIGALTDLLSDWHFAGTPASGPIYPLGLHTLGGSNGQSVAGAFSTSTHGGDWDQPPLVDCVRAIHLVTDGGRELWIERASDPITTDSRLSPLLPCAGTEIIRSDDIFNAVLVGFGRFGVIYSMVLEARKAFRVVEVATQPNRASVLQALNQGMATAAPFDALFALLAQAPVPTALVEGPTLATAQPYYFDLTFNSLDQNDLWVRRRWITSELTDNLGGEDPSFLASLGLDALKSAWLLGGNAAAAPLAVQVFAQRMAQSQSEGLRGPHPVVTSGTRAGSHNWSYKSDSVEVIFDAADPAYIDFLNAIQAVGDNYRQAGYISLRPCRASRATLSMHNVAGAHAMSIEVSCIKGPNDVTFYDNDAWMQFVHDTAVAHGGRPHWGQINTLNDRQMLVLYGQQRRNWQIALNRVSGASTIFGNNFTRQRGLEPANAIPKVTAVSHATDQLLVMRKDPGGLIRTGVGADVFDAQATHWTPASGWSGWQSSTPALASRETFFGSATESGYAYFFCIGTDGYVYFRTFTPSGQWTIWWIVGRSNEPTWNGVPYGAVNAVSCQPAMVHVFYTDRQGRILASRADTAGGVNTWPESVRLLGGRTAPGGHVTAVSRRQGQLDVFTVGIDGVVYTCAWNASEGWKGWWPIPGITAPPGAYTAAVSRSLDQLDIFVAADGGKIMSAAWNPSQPAWAGWWNIQGGTTNSGYVTAVSRSPDLLDIFTADANYQVQTAAWDPTHGWGGWWPVTTAKAQSIIWPVSRSINKLDLFFTTPNELSETVAWEPGAGWRGPWTLS
jgi:hypothetical protein